MKALHRTLLTTPYGEMVALASATGLCALEFVKENRQDLLFRRIGRFFPGYDIVEQTDEVIEKTRRWLEDYFSGKFNRLQTPPLDLQGSAFERAVWQAMLAIPPGKTASYREIALKLGKPGGSRAVGGASGRNPVSLIVPCHRVIGQDGSLTGYGGGLVVKAALLTHERAGKH